MYLKVILNIKLALIFKFVIHLEKIPNLKIFELYVFYLDIDEKDYEFFIQKNLAKK